MCTARKNIALESSHAGESKYIEKTYVVLDMGPAKTVYHHLKNVLTIGSSPKNDIYLPDPRVSRRHALIFLEDKTVIIEDRNSEHGTFVNDEDVGRAYLEGNDVIRCGGTRLSVLKERIPLMMDRSLDVAAEKPLNRLNMFESRYPSKRLSALIPEIPLFESICKEDVTELIEKMRFILYDENRTIFHQGDIGRSFYIILDGKVEVYIENGKKGALRLAVLGENQFFGEMSFLTGAPRSAAVRTLETTYLCELDPDIMNNLFDKSPQIQTMLWSYYHRRRMETNETKCSHGISENRKHQRYNLSMKAGVTFLETPERQNERSIRTLNLSTRDISLGGAGIRIPACDLNEIFPGYKVGIELTLPDSSAVVHCLGIVKSISTVRDHDLFAYFSVEFKEFSHEQKKKLESFINRLRCN